MIGFLTYLNHDGPGEGGATDHCTTVNSNTAVTHAYHNHGEGQWVKRTFDTALFTIYKVQSELLDGVEDRVFSAGCVRERENRQIQKNLWGAVGVR